MKTIPEQLLDDVIKDQVAFDKIATGLDRRVQSVLLLVQDEVVGLTAKIDPTAPARSEWKKARLEQLKTEIAAILEYRYSRIDDMVKADLSEIADLQAVRTVKSFNTAIGVKLMNVTLTPELLTAIVDNSLISGKLIGDWWQWQAEVVKDKLMASITQATQVMQIGMVQGESIGELIKRIRGTSLDPGVMAFTKREAEALVRTSVMQVSNSVRQETYKANSDILKGFQVVATLDNRTTEICRALDGLQYDMDMNPIGHDRPYPGGPPFHFNCRSTLVPLTKSWAELTGEDSPLTIKQIRQLDKASDNVKETLGGPVPADMNYEDWLKTLPVKEQQEILGMGKWQLWNEKGLSVRDLVDHHGHVLTLQELRAAYG